MNDLLRIYGHVQMLFLLGFDSYLSFLKFNKSVCHTPVKNEIVKLKIKIIKVGRKEGRKGGREENREVRNKM